MRKNKCSGLPVNGLVGCFCLAALSGVFAQLPDVSEPKPSAAIPTARQLEWQQTEVYSLICYSLTTYQNKGLGGADAVIFNLKGFNANQIARAAKAGGLNSLAFVAKHHDGFALWPTKSAKYNISESPWKGARVIWSGSLPRPAEKQG